MLSYIINFISKLPLIKICIFLLFIIFLLILSIIITYFSIKLFKFIIHDTNLFFNKHTKICKKIINKYRHWTINKLYLIRQPVRFIDKVMLNLLTLCYYSKLINKSKKFILYHISFIIQIKNTKNGKIKLISLDKNLCINIQETFIIKKSYELKEIKLYNKFKHFKLSNIFKITQKRIGNRAFFNWDHYKNNCQDFAKQILITFGVYEDKLYNKFIFKNKVLKKLQHSPFINHIITCGTLYFTFLQKYVFNAVILFE